MKILRTLLNVGSVMMLILIAMLKQEIIVISLENNINVKLNYKIPVVFQKLKNYDSYLIMKELGKFNLKINLIPNELGKCMSFSINNKLILIDSFQILSSSSDSLVKNLNKDYFKYLSQEFDNTVSKKENMNKS